MKKGLLASLAISSVLLLAACGNNSSKTSTTAQETTTAEAVASASAQKYADPSTLKDSYDVIIVGSGVLVYLAAIQAKRSWYEPCYLRENAKLPEETQLNLQLV